MNQDTVEPPSKRFKVDLNGPTNDVNSEIRTASPINGLTFAGNAKVISISHNNVVTNNSRAFLTTSKTPVQNILSNVVVQQPASQVQQTGYVRLHNPINARNVTTVQRAPVPNANLPNKPPAVVSLNAAGGVPIKIPVQGHQLRSPVTLLQQVGNSSASNSIVLQQPLLVQQQQQARPFYVLQQAVATGKQNTSIGQGVTAFVIPQASGNLRPHATINMSQAAQQPQNHISLQKAQVTQVKSQFVSQLQQLPQPQQPQQLQQPQQSQQPQTSTPEVSITQTSCSIQSMSVQQPQPAASSSQTSQGPNNQSKSNISEGKRRAMYQNHLFGLLHARSCKNKNNGVPCSFPICAPMQNIFTHVTSCKLNRACKENGCVLSKQLLIHWKNCSDLSCNICQPIRDRLSKLNSNQRNHIASISAASNGVASEMATSALGTAPNRSATTDGTPVVSTSTSVSHDMKKQWQSEVTEELRTNLVHKLVQAVFPMTTDALKNQQIVAMVENAKKIESEFFEEANSKEEYYHRLAKRIFDVQNDLEERKKNLLALKNGTAKSNGSSAQQQLQNILSRKKEELSSNESIVPSQEVDQTSNKASFPTQEPETKIENGIKDEHADVIHKVIPANKKVWECNELRRYLMPVLEKLYRLDPDSLPFRQPVDPIQLNLPDYNDIIKTPMDLSKIKKRLDLGEYDDPWQFVDDVWLMFSNAWLYNRKGSRVHKSCTRLAEVFEPEIDIVMRSMGFCCGKKYVFCPQVLCCYGKPMCTIPVNASYFGYQNRYAYCEPCFHEIKGEEVELSDDPTQPSIIIQKELFVKTKNSEMEPELFVECTHCGRKQHQICSMYHEPIWPGCFLCNFCIRNPAVRRKENKFTAKNLVQTKLSTYLENRINTFLRDNKSGASPVTIRVHSIMEKSVEIKSGMKKRFCNSKCMSDNLPYTAKAIFAYQEVDGSDVCFFGMHVQEYGSNCPAPNTRRVYIAYLDSINFFQPKVFRTSVYHEILIGYLDYVKSLGFVSAHIWACPPSEGDDYIFHCHPPDMKIPKPKRLADWYKKMLDKAIVERVVIDYKDIIKDALENGIQNVTELPYFEGDFWPNVIETCIAELEQEDHQRKADNSGEFDDSDSVHSSPFDYEDGGSMESAHSGSKRNHKGSQGNKKKTTSKKSGFNKKNNSKTGQAYPGNDLMSKLFVMMEKHREVFFVVRLKNHHAPFTNLPAIHDPDPLISTDLMDGRDNFLMICRERHYEFSSLRRAKHSTMVMLYELHTQAKDSFVYLCNYCRTNIETHYHCSECDDFDLCVPCYKTKGHIHSMEKIGLDLDEDGSSSKGNPSVNGATSRSTANTLAPSRQSIQAKRIQSLERFSQFFSHATRCTFNSLSAVGNPSALPDECRVNNCIRMKQILQHEKLCEVRKSGGCSMCRQMSALYICHSRNCNEPQCLVPFCQRNKLKRERDRTMMNHERAQMMMRRMATMQRGAGMEPLNSSHMQVANQRPSNYAPHSGAQTAPSSLAMQHSGSQARLSFQDQSTNLRQVVPNVASVVQQVKVPVGNAVLSADGVSDMTVSLSQESIQKLLTLKSQQHNISNRSQLITVLKNDPQVQAFIKKQQEQNQANQTSDGHGSNTNILAPINPPIALQGRQQQIILTCNPNVVQRHNSTGGSYVGMMHLNNSNRVMLSQTQTNMNPGPASMQDSSISLQDQLSRYVDQL